jgi:hypothetical protein
VGIADLTSREAVLAANQEFDAVERDAFLVNYGYGPAVEYSVRHNGRLYDSKAPLGAAVGYQPPTVSTTNGRVTTVCPTPIVPGACSSARKPF